VFITPAPPPAAAPQTTRGKPARIYGQAASASSGATALAVTFKEQTPPWASQKIMIQTGRRSGSGRRCSPGGSRRRVAGEQGQHLAQGALLAGGLW
jgi:hypothetical protein